MHVQPTRSRIRIGAVAEVATSPRVLIELGRAPDGLPWLLDIDRSRELDILFGTVPQVFGVTSRDDLPVRVREALERELAAGLMGIHDVELAGRATRAFVARRKLKHLLGPTLLAQLLEHRDAAAPVANDNPITSVGAMASRDQDVELLEAVERSIDALAAKRHLLLDLADGRPYSCSVKDSDRALRTPSAPIAPLGFEALSALGDVDAVLTAPTGDWKVPLANAAGYAAALLRVHQSPRGGGLSFELSRQRVLEQLVGVARAVGELHRRGRVHADLAPGNVLVCAGGPRAFDGLDVEIDTPATAATFEWAAPEQIVGHGVDPRTDVYALGRLAVAIFGGVVFGEETRYVVPIGGARSRVVKVLKGEGVFVDVTGSDYGRSWQRAWQDLLGRCIAYDRGRRPESADRFADELAGLLERYPTRERIALPARFGDVVAVESDGGIAFAHVIRDNLA